MSLEEKIAALRQNAEKLAEAEACTTCEGGVCTCNNVAPLDTPTLKTKALKMEAIDLGTLFDGVELTEEFKTNAQTIFEAAVNGRVAQLEAQMQESIQAEHAELFLNEVAAVKEGLIEKVDGYLDHMVEQWIKDNEIALERGVKAEIFESFVGKMREVFVEHNINLSDDEFDLVESLQDKATELSSKLDEQVAQNVEMNKTLKLIVRQLKIEEASAGMTELDKEKFTLLTEEISFDSEESFVKKLDMIRENYVQDKTKDVKELTENVTLEGNTPIVEEVAKPIVDSAMAQYLKVFNK